MAIIPSTETTEPIKANQAQLTGLFAAVPTPRTALGELDEATFDRLIDFVLERGADGICIGGATSEYPHLEIAEREVLFRRAAGRLPAGAALLSAIGASSVKRVLDLGQYAIDAGSRALLLPMPWFFRYKQDDLAAFCRHVSQTLRAPCLLYDLPEFTNPLDPDTAIHLLRTEEFLVGIKDSSGSADNILRFVQARGVQPWSLLIGDDGAIFDGLRTGWNGSISGIAGVCPELLVALVQSARNGDRARAEQCRSLLDELIGWIGQFPAPWGVRLGLEVRGIETGSLPLPLSSSRRTQARAFQEWFSAWLERVGVADPSLVRP
jgi:4-hydroxy-tetrahydrodipicolinate synthase